MTKSPRDGTATMASDVAEQGSADTITSQGTVPHAQASAETQTRLREFLDDIDLEIDGSDAIGSVERQQRRAQRAGASITAVDQLLPGGVGGAPAQEQADNDQAIDLLGVGGQFAN